MVVFGCSKQSGLEGKIVDAKGNPLSDLKVTVTQTQPTKGFERFETTSSADGSFKFEGLYPESNYLLKLESADMNLGFSGEQVMTAKNGQTKQLGQPIKIRFMALKNKDGVVKDTLTGLMWAANDTDKSIYPLYIGDGDPNLNGILEFSDGGFSDWRLPTDTELMGLFEKEGKKFTLPTNLINVSVCCLLARDHSSTLGSTGIFDFEYGKFGWVGSTRFLIDFEKRILPVRDDK